MDARKPPKKAPANAGAKEKKLAGAARSTGELVDESFSENEVHQVIKNTFTNVKGFDFGAFDTFLGTELGYYRCISKMQNEMLKPSEELQYITRLIHDVERIRECIDQLPPRIEDVAHAFHYKVASETMDTLTCRLKNDLSTLLYVLIQTSNSMRKTSRSKGGRPTKKARDALVECVTKKLKELHPSTSKTAANNCAIDILSVCGISAPDDAGQRNRQRRAK